MKHSVEKITLTNDANNCIDNLYTLWVGINYKVHELKKESNNIQSNTKEMYDIIYSSINVLTVLNKRLEESLIFVRRGLKYFNKGSDDMYRFYLIKSEKKLDNAIGYSKHVNKEIADFIDLYDYFKENESLKNIDFIKRMNEFMHSNTSLLSNYREKINKLISEVS